jgi:hypothetical protein
LLELKVAARAVGIPGLESEVQCNQRQMHECDPFPSPTPTKCSKTFFLLGVKWASVGRGAAPCHWHHRPAIGGLAGWTAPKRASSSPEARPQNPLKAP